MLCFFGTYSYGLYVLHGLLHSTLSRMLPVPELARTLGSVTAAKLVFLLAATGAYWRPFAAGACTRSTS